MLPTDRSRGTPALLIASGSQAPSRLTWNLHLEATPLPVSLPAFESPPNRVLVAASLLPRALSQQTLPALTVGWGLPLCPHCICFIVAQGHLRISWC